MRSAPREEMLSKLDTAAAKTLQRCFGGSDCFPLPTSACPAINAALRQFISLRKNSTMSKLDWESVMRIFARKECLGMRPFMNHFQSRKTSRKQLLESGI